MKSHFQDEYIAGVQHQWSPAFNWGAKLTYRVLRSAIDDTCTPVLGGHCLLFNPGVAKHFPAGTAGWLIEGSDVQQCRAGSSRPLKRKYYALDLYVEHPSQGGKWYGKLEYTFSRNYGNTEGQLASDLDIGAGGQSDVSRTQDWDLPQLMVGANGLLPNHRSHQPRRFAITRRHRSGASARRR